MSNPAEMGSDERTTSRPTRLTPREAEVLERLGRAMTNQEIGDDLYLSVNSVKTHVRNLFRKIGVANRTEAVLWLHDHAPPAPSPSTADASVGVATGILMAEGGVDAAAATAVLVERSAQAGQDLRAVAHDLVVSYDTFRRPLVATEQRVELLELCRKVRTAAHR